MTDKPNADDFSYELDETDYRVELEVRGKMTVQVEASSKDEARKKAEQQAEMLWEDGVDIDEIDDISVGYITAPQKMYRVLRDGRNIRVSYLQPGDLPREPTETGF